MFGKREEVDPQRIVALLGRPGPADPGGGSQWTPARSAITTAPLGPTDRGRHRTPGPARIVIPAGMRAWSWRPSWWAVAGGAIVLLIVAGIIAVRVGRASAAAVPTTMPAVASSAGASLRPAGTIRATTSVSVGPAGPAVSAAAPGAASPSGSGTPATAAPAIGSGVVVHVVGQVAHPGLVRLASGARVDDAIAAAGGLVGKADVSRVNLARPLLDGEQVMVPARGQVLPPSSPSTIRASSTTGTSGSPGVLDLNTADAAALQRLPRVGPVLAERILQWRAQHGRFTSVAELTEVPGIGPALLATLSPHVRV